MRVLITYHADINAADNEKRSALQSAAWQGHVKVVQLLIEHGAVVDHTCNQGATALCIAAQEGHIDVVQVLLEHGADPNHADQFGRTAMRVAAKNGHSQIIKLLEKYGASSLNGCSPSPVHTMEQKPLQSVSSKMQSLTIKSNSSGSTGGGDMQASLRGLPNGPAHAFSSPSESPDSTVDRQKSSLSNNSLKSSKNSSLRTTSSTATAQTVPIDSFHNLSFTEQIQQHSLPRSRSRQSIVSPSSTTQSLGQSHNSPSSEFEWSQVKPSLKSTKTNKGGKSENSSKSGSAGRKAKQNNSSQPKVLEYEMTQFDSRGPAAKPGSSTPPKQIPAESQCKIMIPSAQQEVGRSQQQFLIHQQSGEQKKRNGIMTNPNYHLQSNQVFLGRVSVPRTIQDRGHQEVLEGYPSSETELSLKQALKLQIDGSDPSFNYKKETPL
ncbi:Ankyrin repeat domain-containing protein 50 [Myotis davidii]|uniref:Ankyrin repeat domain-containing protein 50 n=1 Tax=Myotis davidii TaxID=225400 RepID=L5LXU5_MYODS|nr:Ankyrin repeat domain-containing protein 50 [Myotis davidii]